MQIQPSNVTKSPTHLKVNFQSGKIIHRIFYKSEDYDKPLYIKHDKNIVEKCESKRIKYDESYDPLFAKFP